jgi:replicative DNA helicase
MKKELEINLNNKPLPCDLEIEKLLLGAYIESNNDSRNEVLKIITKDSFYDVAHQKIFEVLTFMSEHFIDIDIITVCHNLKSFGYLDEVGNEIYISELSDRLATSKHIITYAAIVQEYYITRKIIEVCSKMSDLAYNKTVNLDELISNFETEIKSLQEKAETSLPNEKRNLVNNVLKSIEQISLNNCNKNIYKTCLNYLDNIITLMPNEIIYLAGPPKSAKTKILIKLMDKLIEQYSNELNIYWCCMEDPAEKIIRNRMSIHTGIKDEKILGLEGHISKEEYNLLQETKQILDNNQFVEYIDYPMHIDNIYRNYTAFVKKDKMNILIIDNFNICVGMLYTKQTQIEKEEYIASKIQHLNSYLKHKGYKSIVIIVDHLRKDLELKLEYGYRPSTRDLKGSERKYAILTQLILVNRPGKYRDLLAEESLAPDIEINGVMWKRKDLLAGPDSEGLIILERTEARNGNDQGENVISRIYAKINTMQFIDIKNL